MIKIYVAAMMTPEEIREAVRNNQQEGFATTPVGNETLLALLAERDAKSKRVEELEEAVGLLKAHGRFSSDVDAFLAKLEPEDAK
jgi:HD-like signal output (HDOD) protein